MLAVIKDYKKDKTYLQKYKVWPKSFKTTFIKHR
jgi:hypothetical protein